jgi:hypothetical protein
MSLEKKIVYNEKFEPRVLEHFIQETKKYLKKNPHLGLEAFYETMYELEKIEKFSDYKLYAKKILQLIKLSQIKLTYKKELFDIYKQTAIEILPQLRT